MLYRSAINISLLLFLPFIALSQYNITDIEYFESYENCFNNNPLEVKTIAIVKEANDEFIEIVKIINTTTRKRYRPAQKAWALKYNGSLYLNTAYTNSDISPSSFIFVKIDSITPRSIFILLPYNKLNQKASQSISQSGTPILDLMFGLRYYDFKDSLNTVYRILFISKKRLHTDFFTYHNYFWDISTVYARIISYGELLTFSDYDPNMYEKIKNKEMDQLDKVLQFLDNLP